MHIYNCEMSLALTYSLKSPKLAKECAEAALKAARTLDRPDLMYAATELLSSLKA